MLQLLSKLVLGEIVRRVETEKSFKRALADLQEAIRKNGFSIKHIHDLRATFEAQGLPVEEDFEYSLVQFCHAEKALKALRMSRDVGVMMPKTIIVGREKGRTFFQFMKMRPFMVRFMFPSANLVPMSKQVTATMERIVAEAA